MARDDLLIILLQLFVFHVKLLLGASRKNITFGIRINAHRAIILGEGKRGGKIIPTGCKIAYYLYSLATHGCIYVDRVTAEESKLAFAVGMGFIVNIG